MLKTKVKPKSMRVILIGLAVLILVNLLARFDVIDLAAFQSDVLTLIGATFLAFEIALMSVVKSTAKGKLNVVDLLIGLIVVFAVLGVVLGWLGITVGFLESIRGIVEVALLIGIIVEIFRG